jgi:hypothetical protein
LLLAITTTFPGAFVPPADAVAPASCRGHVATVVGGPRPDVLFGTPHRDVIVGKAGDDVLIALGGSDLVCGRRGLDTINGGWGFDVGLGGKGDDDCVNVERAISCRVHT